MGKKIGFFARNPLGDGINSLVLSNNLYLQGFEVDTYNISLCTMKNWFPHLPILPYPAVTEIPALLRMYDQILVVWDAKTEFITTLVKMAKRECPEKIRVIYLYPSKSVIREPYYSDCPVDMSRSVVDNLYILYDQVLKLPNFIRQNGFQAPNDLVFRKHSKRVVMHPTGSGEHYWPREKFIQLAHHIESKGYQVVMIPGQKHMKSWQDCGFETVDFETIDGLARYIYESAYLVGSDSGPGHLASSFGIHTLTICRRKALANLWRPSLAFNVVLTPSSLIPNFHGLRLRDQHWDKFITLSMAYRGFEKIVRA